MEYKIHLKKTTATEPFEEKRDNVAEIYIQGRGRTRITSQGIVSLSLSKDAMIELGKELICQALSEVECDITHFYPARPNEGLVISYGVIIHPNSVEPILEYCDNFDSIETDINKTKRD